MTRRPRTSIVANPVLVGSVTVLVTVVAVWLAYNANDGLPFVPTVRVDVELANGANLIKGSEVREGGFRVGAVADMRPVTLPGGRVGAEAALRLDQAVGALPADSLFVVRGRGAIGAKYIDIQRGRSPRRLPDGATVPTSRTRIGVDLDEVLSTFDPRTRQGERGTLLGLGNGLAGRGADVNAALDRLPRLLADTTAVMGNLAGRDTDLAGFVDGAAAAAGALAPVAGDQARLFDTMADTFAALSRDPAALEATITESARTIAAGTRSLRDTRPFLEHASALARSLEPTTVSLRRSLGDIDAGLRPVPAALSAAVPLAGRAGDALGALGTLTRDPATNTALRGLSATVRSLIPQLRYYGPAFTVCRLPQIWLQDVPDVLDAVDSTGFSQRGIIATTDDVQHDDLSSMGANEWVTGRGPRNGPPQYLHADGYNYYVDDQGRADCLNGQGGYRWGWNPNDTTPDRFYKRVMAEHFPGGPRLGPLWSRFDRFGHPTGQLGPDRVPAGETFSRNPGGRAAPKAP